MSDYAVYEGKLVPVDEFMHHGIKGMKWGVRRYQNPDGTLTEEGRDRYIRKGDRDSYDRYVQGQLKGKNKDQKSKILREESRRMSETVQEHNRKAVTRTVATFLAGGAGGMALSAITANPVPAIIGIGANWVNMAMTAAGSTKYVNNAQKMANVINKHWDEANIDKNVQRRLNV